MAVTKQYFFPDTPASGDTVELVPLAGNGYTAPHSYYAFEINANGDVSGGALIIQIRFDQRYTSIVPYMTARTNDNAADVDAQMSIVSTNIDRVVNNFTLVFENATLSSDVTWEPPPIIVPGLPRETLLTAPWARFLTVNVNTENYNFFGRIYNFKIDALKHTALPVLLSVLPR